MRRRRPRPVDLQPTYSSGQHLAAALLCVAAVVTVLVAATYPAAAAAGTLLAGGAVTARTLVRVVRTHQIRGRDDDPDRQRHADSSRICVPATDVCLGP